jgi:hypothetical protein
MNENIAEEGGHVATDRRLDLKSDSPKPSVSFWWRWFSTLIVLAIVVGSYIVGGTLTLIGMELLKTRIHWISSISGMHATEAGGVLFGLVPAYILSKFVWSRRQATARGFEVGGTRDASLSENCDGDAAERADSLPSD